MRKSVISISSLVLIFSGLGMSPANAVTDGTYPCSTSGTFTVDSNVVTLNTDCAGSAAVPSGVIGIGDYAFQNSSGLTEISIPESVISIGDGAFAVASGLKSIDFAAGSSLGSIGDDAFQDTALRSMLIPASVTEIGARAFSSVVHLSSVEFEANSSLTTIGRNAFQYTFDLRLISLPQGLTTIGDYAFQYANLDYVEIPASVTSLGIDSFQGLGLVTFYFHGIAPAVGLNAFAASYGALYASTNADLLTFTITDGSWNGFNPAGLIYDANFDSTGGTSVRPGVFGIGTGFYAGGIYEIGAAPKPPTKSGSLFAGWSATNGGEKIDFPYIPGVASDITFYARWTLPFDAAAGDGFVNCSTSGTFTIVDNVVKESNSCLGIAEIPDSVTEIFDSAFANSSLTSARFGPNSELKFIGDSAFKSASLENIIIPSSLTSIEYRSFYDTENLNSVTFAPDSKLKTIGDSAFEGSGLSAISIPANVTHIWSEAFYEAYELTSVSFAGDSKLTHIGSNAFSYAESLAAIEIPASVISIDNSAFEDANELASITFAPGSKLSYIGSYAFASTPITSIQIPAGVHFLRNHLFQSANNLVDIYFLGDAPSVTANQFSSIGSNPRAHIKSTATGFPAVNSLWNGLTVDIGVYDVAFNSNGGSEIVSDSFVAGGAIAEPETPFKSGYTFAGWLAADGGTVFTFPYSPVVISNINLFAKWKLNEVPGASSPLVSTPLVSAPAAVTTAKKLSKSIGFSSNSKVLTKANKTAIKKSVTASGKDAKYVVTGTAGLLPGSTVAQAKKLAKLRANTIKAYLVKLGVSKSNITIKIKISNQGIVPKTKILASYLTS